MVNQYFFFFNMTFWNIYLCLDCLSFNKRLWFHLQYSGSGMVQQGGQYVHQGQQMTQQQLMAARSSLLYAQQPFSPLSQHQPFHTHLGITPSSSSSAPPPPHHFINTDVGPTFPDFGRSDHPKQDSSAGGTSGEALYLKPADD